jgi:hypothetical protein
MLPVVVVEFDSSASYEQQEAVLAACSQALATTECIASGNADARPTRAVAVVSWASSLRVHLEVGLRSVDRWITHEIAFGQGESREQQWRAIGFSIATLVGEEGEAPGNAETTASSEVPSLGVGVRLAPRVALGLDRPTTLAGGELTVWASPFSTWTPLVGLAYSVPVQPSLGVSWRELELALGAALVQPIGSVELRETLALTATRIAVSDGQDALDAWVAGAQVSAELRWPRGSWWTLATRLGSQLNDGSTGVFEQGERLASSPAWLFAASSGLELTF